MFLVFAVRHAIRILRRGGLNTMLALICIAFGTLSLVVMQTLATTMSRAVVSDSRAMLGGDALIADGGMPLSPAELAEVEQLHTRGIIAAYTPFAQAQGGLLKPTDDPQVYVVNRARGIDPATFPLVGEIRLRAPVGATLADVLAEPDSAVLTRDLADKFGMQIDDTFLLGGQPGTAPLRLRLTGIIQSMPDQRGDRLFYNLATAQHLAGQPDVVTSVAIIWGAQGDQTAQLRQTGWYVETDEQVAIDRSTQVRLFTFMFRGAGLLGLLIGGLGVATTIQTVLTRRTSELAVLKTLGYNRRHLALLLGIEVGMLGSLGSVLGVILGVALSVPFVTLLGRTNAQLVEWAFDPWLVGGVLVAGTITTIIAGLRAVLIAAVVPPARLLRQLPGEQTHTTHASMGGVYALLLLIIIGLSSLIMQSLPAGLIVVLVSAVGFILVGTLLILLFRLLMSIPLVYPRLLFVAQQNLNRTGLRIMLPLTALCIGAFAVGLSTVVFCSAQAQAQAQVDNEQTATTSVAIYTRVGNADAVAARFGIEQYALHRVDRLPIRAYTSGGLLLEGAFVLEGRERNDIDNIDWNVQFDAAPNLDTESIYLPDRFQTTPWDIERNDQITHRSLIFGTSS
jgi:putative ABC transport system permease protein